MLPENESNLLACPPANARTHSLVRYEIYEKFSNKCKSSVDNHVLLCYFVSCVS